MSTEPIKQPSTNDQATAGAGKLMEGAGDCGHGSNYLDGFCPRCELDRKAEAPRESQEADDERALEQAITERDNAEEWADKLAYAVAPEEEIGEHSNLNNPWANALEILESRSGESQPAAPSGARGDKRFPDVIYLDWSTRRWYLPNESDEHGPIRNHGMRYEANGTVTAATTESKDERSECGERSEPSKSPEINPNLAVPPPSTPDLDALLEELEYRIRKDQREDTKDSRSDVDEARNNLLTFMRHQRATGSPPPSGARPMKLRAEVSDFSSHTPYMKAATVFVFREDGGTSWSVGQLRLIPERDAKEIAYRINAFEARAGSSGDGSPAPDLDLEQLQSALYRAALRGWKRGRYNQEPEAETIASSILAEPRWDSFRTTGGGSTEPTPYLDQVGIREIQLEENARQSAEVEKMAGGGGSPETVLNLDEIEAWFINNGCMEVRIAALIAEVRRLTGEGAEA